MRRCQDKAWGIPWDVLSAVAAVVAVDKNHPQAGIFGAPHQQRLRLGPGQSGRSSGAAAFLAACGVGAVLGPPVRPCLSFPLTPGWGRGQDRSSARRNANAAPRGARSEPGAVGGERERGVRARLRAQRRVPCRMALRAAALAVHACLLAALHPGDPNVCSYWER